MHRLRGGGESVALEYYFRAIDEFTTLTSQLFDEAFSFFFFFFGIAFFGEISFSMDGNTLEKRVSRDGI